MKITLQIRADFVQLSWQNLHWTCCTWQLSDRRYTYTKYEKIRSKPLAAVTIINIRVGYGQQERRDGKSAGDLNYFINNGWMHETNDSNSKSTCICSLAKDAASDSDRNCQYLMKQAIIKEDDKYCTFTMWNLFSKILFEHKLYFTTRSVQHLVLKKVHHLDSSRISKGLHWTCCELPLTKPFELPIPIQLDHQASPYSQ